MKMENDLLFGKIKELANKHYHGIKAIREHLHAHPELSFKEFKTAAFISSKLNEAGIPHQTGVAGTGIVGLISGNNSSHEVILLRADMDALPIQEQNNVYYKSTCEGVMHACGHDVHTSCLLGALYIIHELKDELPVQVKFIFQPGEEVLPGGASLMIKEGILQNPIVNKAVALHVFPSLEVGKIGFKSGMYMASTDEIYITVNGKGGHAAMPNDYINPLLVASDLLLKLNSDFMLNKIHQQKNDEFKTVPTVLAFGKIQGLGATNVIPEVVKIDGTFRTMNEKWRLKAHQEILNCAKEIENKWGAIINIQIINGYPFLVNHDETTKKIKAIAENYLGKNNVAELPIRMTAEDFSYISQKVNSCFFRLGTGNKSKNITSGVHTPTFDIDEKSLEIGMTILAMSTFFND
jgi:amidohydrolase